jgi:hypothetical protein
VLSQVVVVSCKVPGKQGPSEVWGELSSPKAVIRYLPMDTWALLVSCSSWASGGSP